MPRDVLNGPEHVRRELGETVDQRLDQRAILVVSGIEIDHGIFDRMFQHHGRAVIQRLRARRVRFNQGISIGSERKNGLATPIG